MAGESHGPSDGDKHLILDLSHVELEVPDFDLLKQQRLERNRQTMEAADKGISREILPEVDQNSAETKAAIVIQKTYRGFLGRKVYTDRLYAKYEEEERLRLEKMELQMHEGELLVDNYNLQVSIGDRQTVRRNKDRYLQSQVITIQRAWRNYLRHRSTDSTRDTNPLNRSSIPLTTTIADTHTPKSKAPSGGEVKVKVTDSLEATPHDLSDHDDENSETESAIAGCAMTLLTPEENQGGGDDSSATAPVESEDDLDTSQLLDGGLTSDPDDISPTLPPTVAQVPSIKPVLNSQDILLGLEREKHSPSRFSVDVECESVVSDYSELGGPLRDIERDVNFIDKDALRAEDAFLQLTLSPRESIEDELEKREDETEEDFERRVRKVNLLSLAQEFAELKKVDAQACAIDFHRNQSSRSLTGRGCSPLGSRGQSLDRSGRRSHSKSPLRSSGRHQSKDIPKNFSSMSEAGEEMATNHPDLPKNYEQRLGGQDGNVPEMDDLPVNEARRRNSNADLPANMRPERCGNSPSMAQNTRTANLRSRDASGNRVAGGKQQSSQGSSSDFEGDFEVYNIETALPQMNWKMLEEQLQAAETEEKNRLEKCKNDREEIRRRLAMATDEEVNFSGSGGEEEVGESTADLSPRKQRLQARLQGAPSGMQICFMNDDILDDEDDENTARYDEEVDTETTPREGEDEGSNESETMVPLPNHPCFPGEIEKFTSKQSQLQTEATLALAQASTMARMQLEVEKQTKKKSPIADMVGIPTLGNGRRLRLNRNKLQEMNIAQLQVLVNDLHSQIELLNEDLVHLLIERDDLHMEQDSMLVDIEDLTSHCHDPKTTNNNKSTQNNNRPASRRDRHK